MIHLSNITMRFAEPLFENLSFVLGNKEKVGLVGLNGTGKSTLLKIIAGELKPDEGTITLQREIIGYLPQEFSFDKNLLVGEYYEILADELSVEFFRVQKEVNKLEIDHIDEYAYVDSLSPGQKMKLYLLKLILTDATILLLDEPTNHLDIDGIIWFEKYISRFDGIVIIISHDREFLDNAVDTIFEITEQKLFVYPGNYTDFIEQKQGFIEERAKQAHLYQRKQEKLERLLENSRKIKDGKKRGKAVEAAKKRIAREEKNKVEKYHELKLDTIALEGKIHKSKRMLQIKDLSFAYPNGENILDRTELSVYGNETVWLLGANGIGKSTLIKILTGSLKPTTGEYKWGENIKWRYFSQEQEHLPDDEELGEYFMKMTNVTYDQSFGLLEKYLFPKSMRNNRIGSLSPGQRARLSFAIFSMEENDCLILDEPTNHLDLNTKSAIEESLKAYKGALILVSHDRAFAKAVNPSRIITIEDKKLKEVF